MQIHHPFLLLSAGLVAGAMNAAAGGGSFVTFPALVLSGVPPTIANATSTMALLPGGVAGAIGYRKDIRRFKQVSNTFLFLITMAGGGIGALLLLFTSSNSFKLIVPWLLLAGSITFAFGGGWSEKIKSKDNSNHFVIAFFQLLLGIYGGYFGGAVSIMMLAVWRLFNLGDIKQLNANKTVFVVAANAVAAVLFILAGKIFWNDALLMMAATIAGGYAGARWARKLNPTLLRTGISIMNFIITLLFFYTFYF